MFSLIILILVLAIFVVLAVKNWRMSIGAGPTILIVGVIVVSVYGALKYSDYQSALREYDSCDSRVTRSQEGSVFNQTLIGIIDREFPTRGDISAELQAVVLQPLDLFATCGRQPTFLESL